MPDTDLLYVDLLHVNPCIGPLLQESRSIVLQGKKRPESRCLEVILTSISHQQVYYLDLVSIARVIHTELVTELTEGQSIPIAQFLPNKSSPFGLPSMAL